MNTEYGGFQFITISMFKIQNIEMALKSTSTIEDIEFKENKENKKKTSLPRSILFSDLQRSSDLLMADFYSS